MSAAPSRSRGVRPRSANVFAISSISPIQRYATVGARSVEPRPAPGPRGRTDDADVDDATADDLRDFADRRRRDRVAVDVERSRARRAHRGGDLFGERLRLRGRDDGKEDLARHEE